MSPQEHVTSQYTPNKLQMKPDSAALAPEPSHIPHHTGQVAEVPLGNSRDSMRHLSLVYRKTNFSTATRGKFHAPQIGSK